jgi:hypothetical protein
MPEETADSLITQVTEVVEELFDPADPASKGRLKKLLIFGGFDQGQLAVGVCPDSGAGRQAN